MIRIEKEYIPPSPKRGRGRPAVYPFRRMDVLDHFFVPDMEAKKMDRRIVYWEEKLEGHKFHCTTVRADGAPEVDSKGREGVRVWRDE